MIKGIKLWKTTVPIQQKIKIVLNLKIKKSHTLTSTICTHRSGSVCMCVLYLCMCVLYFLCFPKNKRTFKKVWFYSERRM